MDWKGSVVGFNNGVWNLWWWHDWEGGHNSVWVFFTNLGDEKSSHAWTGTTTKWVGDLETLEAITTFSFFTDNIENWVNKLSTFSVVTLSPVVTSTSLSEDEVIRSEKLTEWSSADWVHSAGLEIHKDCSWNVTSTCCLVEINVDTFKLEVWVTVVGTSWVNSVFIRDDFPEFGTDLVTTLTSLDVNNVLSKTWIKKIDFEI